MAYGSVKIDSITTSTKTVAVDNLSVNGNINNASIAIDAAIAFSKLQNISAADKILGRGSSGAGAIEEITCTAAGRALLDDVDAAAQRTTLGLGTLATQSGTFSGTSSGTNTGDQTISLTGDVTGSGTGSFAATIANDAVTYAKIQNVSATDKILGRSSAGSGDIQEITCTAAGRALLDDADAAAQRTTLGLGTLATQNGTFSGTSSGTNTGDQTITLTGDVTGSGTGSFAATIANDSVTYAKIQNVSATDRLLGRSSSGSGDIEEVTCTAAGRALIDDADATAQRTTLGLGSLATLSSISNTNVATNAAIAGSKIAPNFTGYVTEDPGDGTAWNVVTQKDIGYAANQVPLNQYLGRMAFVDAHYPAYSATSSAADAAVVVDASETERFAHIASFTADRTIQISNLTPRKEMILYLRNTNASARTITIQASTTTASYANVSLAPGAGTIGAASVSSVTLAATSGTSVVWVSNINGNIVGGLMA